eukprot:Skav200270  [mRNA]  locus=scaffold93:65014:67233:- [translate_table: standard]
MNGYWAMDGYGWLRMAMDGYEWSWMAVAYGMAGTSRHVQDELGGLRLDPGQLPGATGFLILINVNKFAIIGIEALAEMVAPHWGKPIG